MLFHGFSFQTGQFFTELKNFEFMLYEYGFVVIIKCKKGYVRNDMKSSANT